MKKSRNGIRILLLVIFTVIVYGIIANITALETAQRYEKSITSTPVTVTVTPSPTAPIVPTPTAPIVKELISGGYTNKSLVVIRKLPEISQETYMQVVPIGTRIRVVGMCEVKNKIWYKTEHDTYIYSEFVTLDRDLERVTLASRGNSDIRGFNTNLTGRSSLTNEQIEYLLRGGGMETLSDTILYCEKVFKLNAFFIISVGKLESANGTSKLARTKNNLFGFNAYGDVDKNATVFDTRNDSIYRFSELIRNNYINKGLTTLPTIGKVYCESPSWSSKVKAITDDSLRRLRSYSKI